MPDQSDTPKPGPVRPFIPRPFRGPVAPAAHPGVGEAPARAGTVPERPALRPFVPPTTTSPAAPAPAAAPAISRTPPASHPAQAAPAASEPSSPAAAAPLATPAPSSLAVEAEPEPAPAEAAAPVPAEVTGVLEDELLESEQPGEDAWLIMPDELEASGPTAEGVAAAPEAPLDVERAGELPWLSAPDDVAPASSEAVDGLEAGLLWHGGAEEREPPAVEELAAERPAEAPVGAAEREPVARTGDEVVWVQPDEGAAGPAESGVIGRDELDVEHVIGGNAQVAALLESVAERVRRGELKVPAIGEEAGEAAALAATLAILLGVRS